MTPLASPCWLLGMEATVGLLVHSLLRPMPASSGEVLQPVGERRERFVTGSSPPVDIETTGLNGFGLSVRWSFPHPTPQKLVLGH